MTRKPSQRNLAQAVLREVKRTFAYALVEDCGGPVLVKGYYDSHPNDYAIVWEDGPYEWALLAASGGVDEELSSLGSEFGMVTKPKDPIRVEGAFIEPIYSFALGVYRD